MAALTRAAPPPSEKQTAIASSPLTLSIERPTESTFRLIYLPDEGWKFADRADDPRPSEAALTSTAMPQPAEGPAVKEPLTVFIDGPTRYTYVWMRDEGWKFVGRITDQKR